MATIKGTPAQLESMTGISQSMLSNLLRLAEKNGEARIVDKVKKDGVKGKPSNVWEVNTTIKIVLVDDVATV